METIAAEIELEARRPEAVEAILKDLRRRLDEAIDDWNASEQRHNRAQGTRFERMTDADFDALRAAATAGKMGDAPIVRSWMQHWNFRACVLQTLESHTDANAALAAQLLSVLGWKLIDSDGKLNWQFQGLIEKLHGRSGKPTLLELDTIVRHFWNAPTAVVEASVMGFGEEWPEADRAPFFESRVASLLGLLHHDGMIVWRPRILSALGTLPRTPEEAVPRLFELAFAGNKEERRQARAALHRYESRAERVIEALGDGKAAVRAIAADWIADLPSPEAIAALQRAVLKEKDDTTKGAMLDGLEAMGQPVDRYIDARAMEKDLGKLLAKGVPADLAWLPLDRLPAVHWSASGEPVIPTILQGLLVQAFKQKSSVPTAVLRKVCARFVPGEREALGQFVLNAWIAQDLKPVSPDQAMKKALEHAGWLHGSKHFPEYGGRTLEEIAAMVLHRHSSVPAGSAIGCKGLFAVVAACAGAAVVPVIHDYLKTWYGYRAGQGRALIILLAWIDHPAATQLLLSIGSRFRTKGFQEEAHLQANALAERRGWTMEELADRTIPSAGFDENGLLELSFGPRTFSARLIDDFKIELLNPEGKKIAALPDPRQDDDAVLAKDAKKGFSNAKKLVKGIVTQQTANLRDAMCTQRNWSFEDWDAYLHRHAIMRKLVQQVVWVAHEGEAVRTFRPLDDGTLTDLHDEAVTPTPDARIVVAHASQVDATTAQGWLQHLRDYQVKPLFPQFGRPGYRLPEELAQADALKDIEGHVVQSFSLRNRATKLGYQRGAPGDGGWLTDYERRYPALGLQARIEFSGSPLPEENRPVALLTLSFVPLSAAGAGRRHVRLGDVPPILLSETVDDLRLISAEGSGYDPDWKSKINS